MVEGGFRGFLTHEILNPFYSNITVVGLLWVVGDDMIEGTGS